MDNQIKLVELATQAAGLVKIKPFEVHVMLARYVLDETVGQKLTTEEKKGLISGSERELFKNARNTLFQLNAIVNNECHFGLKVQPHVIEAESKLWTEIANLCPAKTLEARIAIVGKLRQIGKMLLESSCVENDDIVLGRRAAKFMSRIA